jgi:tetratricopeptide (TPR) repeat protein
MKTLVKIPSLVLALGAFSASSQALAAADICIDNKAKEALSACPNTGPKEMKGGTKKAEVSFHSVTPTADPKKAGDGKPKNPGFEQGSAIRDDRKAKLQNRQRALLITEISKLEELFKTTPKNSADRPQLARRLAENYVELEAAAFREKTQAEIDRDALKKSNPTEAGKKQALVQQAAGILISARKKAVDYYSLVVKDYPNYQSLDEVLYYLAYEYEQANDNDNARKVYYDLTQKRPDSKYVPNAYLAFGELFFNEAQGDPSRWDLAAQSYQKVIGYPAEKGNKVYGYAWYKLAYVFWNKGEYDKAMNAFKKTIDYGTAFATVSNASKLADAARRDIVPVYALQGNPKAAYNFFHGLSGDAGGANEKTYKMMDDLGQNYLDTGHYPEAIELYKDLMTRDRSGAKQCLYQVHVSEAVMAMKSGNKDAIVGELTNQVKAYNEFKSGGQSADAKHECSSKTAALITETAMAWHIEAVGSNQQRGTNDLKTMALSAQLYQKVVDSFEAKEYGTFEFPRLTKEDWPSIYKIKYNMADLLYFQKDWAKCGPAFDAVVADNPTGPDAAEAAYASVLCYQSIYEAQHPKAEARKGFGNGPGGDKKKDAKEDEFKPKDMTDNQKGMVTAFNRYICYIKPAKTDTEGLDKLVEVKYARARTYFEAHHWEEAGMAFREIALEHADKDVGIYAAQLYLESVNVVGTNYNPPRPACFDDMATDVPKFLELYCNTPEKQQKNEENCTQLSKVQADILAVKGQKLVELADKQQGPEAIANYTKGGNTYFEVFKKYCQEPVANKQKPQSEKCDILGYNAARAFQAARLIASAIQARTALINFDKATEGKSQLAKKAVYEIGGNFQAIAVYEKAAEYYERYACANPKECDGDTRAENADRALSDAVSLRLGLGQEEEAIRDAKAFRERFGAGKPAQTASIAFAIGAHYADKEDWDKARAALVGSMGVIDKAAPDIQVQAHATLGRSYSKLKGGQKQASGEYAKVRGLWTNADEAIGKIKTSYQGEDEAAIGKRVGKALNAVGEAYFMAAEDMRERDVESIKFPAYKGAGTKEDVLKHINTKVKDWLDKKMPAIDKVGAEYKKIVDLKPEPPPRWVIAAGSRVGLMWGGFVDEFRGAPIPTAWKSDPEMRGIYYDALDGKSQPIKDQKAKPALVTCLTYSVKFQFFDQFSRNCEVWLSKNYKAEYHVVDELRGAPTLANSGLDEKSPPLLIGGTFWHPVQAGGPDKPMTAAAEDGNKPPAKKPAGGKKGK